MKTQRMVWDGVGWCGMRCVVVGRGRLSLKLEVERAKIIRAIIAGATKMSSMRTGNAQERSHRHLVVVGMRVRVWAWVRVRVRAEGEGAVEGEGEGEGERITTRMVMI